MVWRYFGFSKDDEKIAICKACLSEVKYSGGTTNLSTHLKRHHQIDVAAAVPKGTTASFLVFVHQIVTLIELRHLRLGFFLKLTLVSNFYSHFSIQINV